MRSHQRQASRFRHWRLLASCIVAIAAWWTASHLRKLSFAEHATGTRSVDESPNPSLGRRALHKLPVETVLKHACEEAFAAGVVKSTGGSMLPGADICLLSQADFALEPITCVRSDSRGSFRLEVDAAPLRLLVSAPGHRPWTSQILPSVCAPHQDGLVVVLSPGGGELSGVVLDASGGVVAGALVTARAVGSTALLAAREVDENGRFNFNAAADAVDIEARAEGYSRISKRLATPARNLHLVLAPASAIVGTVVAARSGAPVAGARVTAFSRNGSFALPRSVRTDADGGFQIDEVPAGGYELVAVSATSRSEMAWASVGINGTTAPVQLTVFPAATLDGLVYVGAEVCSSGSVTLQGRVSEAQPIAGDGRVRFEGMPAGRYDVNISCLRHADASASHPRDESEQAIGGEYIVELGNDAMKRTWTLPAPSAGEEAATEFVGKIRVSLSSGPADDSVVMVAKGPRGQFMQGQRRGEQIEFDVAVPGEYELYPAQDPSTSQVVNVPGGGKTVDVRFALSSAAPTSGRVVDASGAPVVDAWIQAASAPLGQNMPVGIPVLTDARGRFSIEGLYLGRYRLEASNDLGEAALDDVQAGSQDSILRLNAYGRLSGRVETRNLERVASFVLHYGRTGEREVARKLLGVDGNWNLPWLAPGTYELAISSNEGSASGTVQLSPGESSEVVLVVDPSKGGHLPFASISPM